jgi:transcriptional regulator with GAF, ATPase, and Fis domain
VSSIMLLNDGVPRLKLPVGDSCRIGRSSECDLQLLDHQLSRVHARIERRGDAHWLEDLGSRNGTFLAGVRVSVPVRLAVGDEVSLGGLSVIFDPPVELLHERGGDKTLYLVEEDVGGGEPVEGRSDAAVHGLALDPSALVALHQLTCELAGELDPEALAVGLMDRLLAFFGADRGFVLLHSERTGRLTPAVIRTEREAVAISRSLVDHALRERVPVLVSDAIEDLTFEGAKSVVAHQLRSVMLAPLLVDGEVIGLVQVDCRERNAFDQERLVQLGLLARAAAVALTNARRFDRARRQLVQAGAADPLAVGQEPQTRFLSADPRMERLLQTTRKAAVAGSRVLITGESGTGKELIARRVHEQSNRAQGPWVAINCAAVPEALMESELFGHEKGAFSGANRRKRGCFELADEGTLFLDEVGELPLPLQVKLLRAIQELTFFRVGGEKPVSVDVRIVAATNRHLPQRVQEGRFREDLFYRLAVLTLELPPLRERPGDAVLLMGRFLERFALAMGKPLPALAPAARQALERYRWPGNVRELKNVAERLVVLVESATIELVDLPAEISYGGVAGRSSSRGKLREALAETERELIALALVEAGGKKVEACRILGISRPTLDKKIADYNLEL